VTRRSLLRRCVFLVAIDPLEVGRRLSWGARDRGSRFVQSVLEPSLSTGRLSEPDRDDLLAFAELVVEGRALAPTDRQYLTEYIDDRTTHSAWHRALYRTTVDLLERLAGQRFARLTVPERVELIVRHRLGVADVWPGEALGRFPDEMRAVRRRAVRDLLGAYYASPAGWAVVGYQSFPGRCGDLTRYTRAES
jgi:hypothetical protein